MNKIKKERSIGNFTRSSDEGKLNYTLMPDFALDRIVELYTEGAKEHGEWNWASEISRESMKSFRESAGRHFHAWDRGRGDEDHFAACVWNMIGYEHVNNKLNE